MNRQRNNKPPVLAAALLGWLLKDEWETPLGDFEEYYHVLAQKQGVGRARWWYRMQVIRMLPDRFYEKAYWSISMLKNYLIVAYRNLLKHKTTSAINIFGLSVGVGCAIVAYLFMYSKVNNEYFHEQGDTISLVGHAAIQDGDLRKIGSTPTPLGPAMASDLPQVVRAVRIQEGTGKVHHGGGEFNQWIRFVDPSFLDLFTFPLREGHADALNDPDAIILSTPAAIKYFGEEDPIGRTLAIQLPGQEEATFTVRGVAKPYNRTTRMGFAVLMPYERRASQAANPSEEWADFTTATFIQVEDPDAIGDIASQMEGYVARQQAVGDEAGTVTAFTFENLYDLALNASDVENSIAGFIPWAPIIILSLMAIFLLVLSCVNYMNIQIATASRRLMEIGMRKVMGGTKSQLVRQYLTENLVICVLALLLGMGIAHLFLLPAFNGIAGQELSLQTIMQGDLWLFLIGLLVGVGLISGAYPGFYISSFQPAHIFRGKAKLGNRNLFMQSLLTVQFVLTFITMIACIGLVMNSRAQQNRDWGYNQEHTLVISLQQGSEYAVLADEVRHLPHVLSVSGAQEHIGKGGEWIDITREGEPMEAVAFSVGPSYLETLGIRLQAGRFFEEALLSTASGNIIVNETFVQTQQWEEPLGQIVRVDSTAYTVIGVTEDFHYEGFSDLIRPALFRLASDSAYQYLSIRVEAGAGTQVAEGLEETWARLQPEVPFEFFFQNTVFDDFYRETEGITHVFLFIAVLALLISCLGLFGLAAQNTASRMKEICIRKVFGASIPHLAHRMNRRFVVLILVAAFIATPVSYFLLNAVLDSIYTYRSDVGSGIFLLAYALVFLTGLLTVSTQLYYLTAAQPAEILRNE